MELYAARGEEGGLLQNAKRRLVRTCLQEGQEGACGRRAYVLPQSPGGANTAATACSPCAGGQLVHVGVAVQHLVQREPQAAGGRTVGRHCLQGSRGRSEAF